MNSKRTRENYSNKNDSNEYDQGNVTVAKRIKKECNM